MWKSNQLSSLKKGVNDFLKSISSYEMNEDNISKAIKEFRRLLISNRDD